MTSIELWMKAAFDQAEEALSVGEVPIGCVFIFRNEIIASGRNSVNETKNATRHAEINALEILFKWCKEHSISYEEVLKECTLYVTVEPCVMCMAALCDLKLGKLVFGCSNDRFGGCGSIVNGLSFCEEMQVIKNIKAEEAVELLKQFYKGTNPNVPQNKS